jgi:hypothetical protein
MMDLNSVPSAVRRTESVMLVPNVSVVEQVDSAYIRKRPLPAITRVPRVTRNLVSTAA